jgi:uncharacterized protein (TIGR03435 family)
MDCKRLWGIRRTAALIAATGLGLVLIAQAQEPAARPQFEVASIKPSAGGSGSSMGMGRAGNFEATNMSLKSLIAEAYRVKTFEVYGGPSWIGSDTYDITAKPTVDPQPGATSKKAYADIQLMLQTLLEDRYALKAHRETKELPVYALVVAKGGLKLKPSDCVKPDSNPPTSPPAAGQSQGAYCGNTMVRRNGQNLVMTGTGITMADLLRTLSRVTDRTVIDRSGHTQTFNATLEWAADQGAIGAPVADGSGGAAESTEASVFTSLQEQLGLKLESTKGPVEVLVIDHVEKPTPN